MKGWPWIDEGGRRVANMMVELGRLRFSRHSFDADGSGGSHDAFHVMERRKLEDKFISGESPLRGWNVDYVIECEIGNPISDKTI